MPTGLESGAHARPAYKACAEQSTVSIRTENLKTVISTYPHLFVLSYRVKKQTNKKKQKQFGLLKDFLVL